LYLSIQLYLKHKLEADEETGMSHDARTIELSRIYLDTENPRHDPIDNEASIIAHLLANENVKALAKHIADHGSTSPLERIGLVEHPKVKGAFVALEGNRRVCALKLLNDPDKADSETNKNYFRTLASNMASAIPKELEVVVFHNVPAARPWISLRHEGEQGGVGTKAWKPEQKARFNSMGEEKNNPNIQALLLIGYARENNLLPVTELAKLSITTLTRYLSNPVFRSTVGLADNKSLKITVPDDQFKTVIQRFLSDALGQSPEVNSRTNSTQREAYAEHLRTDGAAPSTRGLPPHDVSVTPRPTQSPKETTQRNNRSPDDRKTVIDKRFTARITNPVLKRLYDELRDLDAGD
jgi:hypothetical protein